MENRKSKKWDLGKEIREGVQQLTKEMKEIVKDIKSNTSSMIDKNKTRKSTTASSVPYYEEKKLTSQPDLKCEVCHSDFSEELTNRYLQGKDIICERCGQPFGESPKE